MKEISVWFACMLPRLMSLENVSHTPEKAKVKRNETFALVLKPVHHLCLVHLVKGAGSLPPHPQCTLLSLLCFSDRENSFSWKHLPPTLTPLILSQLFFFP